jgi:hypothetical protein
MFLWSEWYQCVQVFQAACSRRRTFVMLVLVLAAFCIRPDCAGVTSFIRALFLDAGVYRSFLHFFNYSAGLNLALLTRIWYELVLSRMPVMRVNDSIVYVVDGLKVPKEGKKMPGVKKLHQSSQNNSKPAYIRGHSFQVLAVLVRTAAGHVAAIPLASRILEGVLGSPRDQRSSLDRMADLFVSLVAATPALLLADAYYASQTVIRPLLEKGHHVLTRVRTNAVAYLLPPPHEGGRRGRPKKYGEKVRLSSYFKNRKAFRIVKSPVYGETKETIEYRTEVLLWHPIGRLVRFVWVIHPNRGRMILMCTDLSIDALKLIETYGYRFKIEVSFRNAVHTIGSYTYHFWMKEMKPRRRNQGDQYLHRESASYRRAVKRKLEAFHRYVQIGCIAQGLLVYLALMHGTEVWKQYRGWMRTIRTDRPPSEGVTASALRSALLDFLLNSPPEQKLKKILTEHMRLEQIEEYQMAV